MSINMTDELPAGSSAYYLARFASPDYRHATTAVLLFNHELKHSVDRCTDPGATRLKLDWWRKELTQASASRHPLAQRLQSLTTHKDGLQALLALIAAAEADVLHQQPQTTDAFIDRCEQQGRLADLLCLAENTPCNSGPLGRYAAAVTQIQQLGRYLQRGFNPLPQDIDLSTDARQWQTHHLAEHCHALLTPLRSAAELAMQDRAQSSRPARRWVALTHAQHRLLERERYPVRDQFVDTTPIAKLWTAWRVR